MPTTRRRHAITETPRVQAALDALRHELGGSRPDLGELVVLGAEEKIARLRAGNDRARTASGRLAAWTRSGDLPVEIEAADEVRRTGWTRP